MATKPISVAQMPLSKDEARGGATRLQLTGVESAGVRPDRGYLQPQQRFLAKFGRPHVGEGLQRLHYAVEQSRDQALNRDFTLPGERIRVVFRSLMSRDHGQPGGTCGPRPTVRG